MRAVSTSRRALSCSSAWHCGPWTRIFSGAAAASRAPTRSPLSSVGAPLCVTIKNMAPLLMLLTRWGLAPAPHGCHVAHIKAPRFTFAVSLDMRTKVHVACSLQTTPGYKIINGIVGCAAGALRRHGPAWICHWCAQNHLDAMGTARRSHGLVLYTTLALSKTDAVPRHLFLLLSSQPTIYVVPRRLCLLLSSPPTICALNEKNAHER